MFRRDPYRRTRFTQPLSLPATCLIWGLSVGFLIGFFVHGYLRTFWK
jgi:hypothetical protein